MTNCADCGRPISFNPGNKNYVSFANGTDGKVRCFECAFPEKKCKHCPHCVELCEYFEEDKKLQKDAKQKTNFQNN